MLFLHWQRVREENRREREKKKERENNSVSLFLSSVFLSASFLLAHFAFSFSERERGKTTGWRLEESTLRVRWWRMHAILDFAVVSDVTGQLVQGFQIFAAPQQRVAAERGRGGC